MLLHPLASCRRGKERTLDVKPQCLLPLLDVSPLLLAQNRILIQSTSVWRPKSIYIVDGDGHFLLEVVLGPRQLPRAVHLSHKGCCISQLFKWREQPGAPLYFRTTKGSKIMVVSLMFSAARGLKDAMESTSQGPEGLGWVQAWKEGCGGQRERDGAINPPYFCSALLSVFVLSLFQKLSI